MASVDDPRGFVEASWGDRKGLLLIDSGSPTAMIKADLVNELELPKQDTGRVTFYTSSGRSTNEYVLIPALTFGDVRLSNVRAFVDPNPDSRIDWRGSFGGDLLTRTDVEFDFAARKINFFSPDHCRGKVVYWPASAVSAIPLKLLGMGSPVISVSLNGQRVDALIDTGSTHTTLFSSWARTLFSLTPEAPGMTKVGSSDEASLVYKYTFDTLDFDGITIHNVPVIIRPDLGSEKLAGRIATGTRLPEVTEENGAAPMVLGMHELRQLHLFLSYNDRMLYVTPAGSLGATTAPQRQGAGSN